MCLFLLLSYIIPSVLCKTINQKALSFALVIPIELFCSYLDAKFARFISKYVLSCVLWILDRFLIGENESESTKGSGSAAMAFTLVPLIPFFPIVFGGISLFFALVRTSFRLISMEHYLPSLLSMFI